MTPFDFSTLRTNHAAGETGHATMHNDERRALKELGRHDRYAVYADDYDSVQAALAAAATRKIPVVRLNPESTYDLSATLTIPANVTLDGGGIAMGELNRAMLRATSALDPMIELGNYSRVVGCRVNGNANAVTGVLVRANFNLIEANWIQGLVTGGAAVKAGGALYTRMVHNAVSNCAGFGLDALDSYSAAPEDTYYGINHGHSEQNVWGGRAGGIRIEGLLMSIADDFEFALDGEAVVTVGGATATQLNMLTPYFEMEKGTAETLIGFVVNGSGYLYVQGGQFYGDNSADSILIDSRTAYGLNVSGIFASRWGTGYAGALANGSGLFVAGNRFSTVTTPSTLSNLPENRVFIA
jgi:hypothetical protein